MNPLSAIIFDFDGVILESLDAKTDAFRKLFADQPSQVDLIVNHHLENLGVSRYDKFRTIYREYLNEPLDSKEMDRLDAAFSELVYDQVVRSAFVAGAPEFLEQVSGRQALYVASATPHGELTRIIEARGLSPYFRAVRGSPGSKDEIVGELLSAHQIDPDCAIVIGDAVSDYHAALSHGVSFIGRVPKGMPTPFGDSEVATVRDFNELACHWHEILAGLGLVA